MTVFGETIGQLCVEARIKKKKEKSKISRIPENLSEKIEIINILEDENRLENKQINE